VQVFSLEFIYIFGLGLTLLQQSNRYNTSPRTVTCNVKKRLHTTTHFDGLKI